MARLHLAALVCALRSYSSLNMHCGGSRARGRGKSSMSSRGHLSLVTSNLMTSFPLKQWAMANLSYIHVIGGSPFFNLRRFCLPIKHVEVRCKLESCLVLGDSTRKLLIPERWACAARTVHCLNICVTMAKYLSFETEYRAFLIAVLVACRICVKTYMRVFYEMYIFAFQMWPVLAFRIEMKSPAGHSPSDTNMQIMRL